MIDLDRAKAHLRVDYDTEDLLIEGYLSAAIAAVERQTGRLLSQRALTQRLDVFPGQGGTRYFTGCAPRLAIALHYDPVVSVEGIDYLASDGTSASLSVDDGGFRIVSGEPCLLLPGANLSWPFVTAGQGAVSVRYTAGYAADEVPGPLDGAVLLLLGNLFANREAVAVGVNVSELPMGFDMMTRPYRRVGLA